LSYEFEVSNQKVAFDVLSGIFTADITKRINRTAFANEVIDKAKGIHEPTYVIAGWYLSDILVLQKGHENNYVKYGYYTNKNILDSLTSINYSIKYLPQQEELNDLRFGNSFTKECASPF
jgi:hypothetical protein